MPEPVPAWYRPLALVPDSASHQPFGSELFVVPEVASVSKFSVYGAPSVVRLTAPAASADCTTTSATTNAITESATGRMRRRGAGVSFILDMSLPLSR